MYAPIYFPPADPVPVPVLAVERAILAAEGPHHVAGRYVADARLAADVRRTEAEHVVAMARRLVALHAAAPVVHAVTPATRRAAA